MTLVYFIRSLKEALEAYHCNISQDVPIVQEIRNEVRKLNTKNTIWEKIMHLEKDLRLTAAMERLIGPAMDRVNSFYWKSYLIFISNFSSRAHDLSRYFQSLKRNPTN